MTPAPRVLLICMGLVAAALGHGARAQSADPSTTPACRTALDRLRIEEDRALHVGRSAASAGDAAAPAWSPATRQRLQALRRDSARACLGGSGDPGPATQAVVPAPTARPLLPSPSGSLAPTAPATSALPPLELPTRPNYLVGCDPTGCRSSDGTVMQRVGPTLVGPRGACSVEGAVVRCP